MWAGRAVSIRGELLQRGAQRFLATTPDGIIDSGIELYVNGASFLNVASTHR